MLLDAAVAVFTVLPMQWNEACEENTLDDVGVTLDDDVDGALDGSSTAQSSKQFNETGQSCIVLTREEAPESGGGSKEREAEVEGHSLLSPPPPPLLLLLRRYSCSYSTAHGAGSGE